MSLDSEVTWSEGDPAFGGFSGLSVAPDGRGFRTISDRGAWAAGSLVRDDDGRIADVTLDGIGPLTRSTASRSRAELDAEGLALDARGRA